MNGWIRLHRKMLEWEWYSCPKTTRLFIHLLLRASWRDARWRGIEIPKGSLFCSVGNLAAETRLSPKCVRLALERLKTTGEVASQTTSKGTLLTLCNWAAYNDEPDAEGKPKGEQNGKPRASEGQTKGKPRATYEEGKEEKKERTEENKNIEPSKARPQTREEFDAYFREIGLYPRDADATWDKWEGNGWVNAGKKIVCWKSTVRSWRARGFMPSQVKQSDFEKPWPEPKRELDPGEVHEFDKDYMAILRANRKRQEDELYRDHPDNWTPEEKAQRDAEFPEEEF